MAPVIRVELEFQLAVEHRGVVVGTKRHQQIKRDTTLDRQLLGGGTVVVVVVAETDGITGEEHHSAHLRQITAKKRIR